MDSLDPSIPLVHVSKKLDSFVTVAMRTLHLDGTTPHREG
jgi:hypothetical protein